MRLQYAMHKAAAAQCLFEYNTRSFLQVLFCLLFVCRLSRAESVRRTKISSTNDQTDTQSLRDK